MAENKIVKDDSGWKTLATGISYRRVNGICFVSFANVALTSTATSFGQLPLGYRPSQEVQFMLRQIQDAEGAGWISVNGDVFGYGRVNSNYNGYVSFPAN